MVCLAEMSEELIGELILYPILFLTGLVFVGLSIPMILKKIPPNQYYGWRTPKAFQSEDIWYEINHYSGRDLCLVGIVQILFNIVMLILRFWDSTLAFYLVTPGNVVILVGGTTIMSIRGFRYLKKL